MAGVAQQLATVTLIADSAPDALLSPYYLNEFQDIVHPGFRQDTATRRWLPLRLATPHPLWLQWSDPRTAQYALYVRPGDTIYVRTHPGRIPYYTFYSRRAGSAREAELNFFTGLQERGLGMNFPDAMGLEQNARYPAQAPRFCASMDQRLRLLQQQHDSLRFDAAFVDFASQQIRAQYLQALFGPYGNPQYRFRQFPAAYTNTLDEAGAAAFLTHDALVRSTQAYRVLATNYIRYLSRDALGTPEELPTLYRHASQALRGQTRDYALFAILKDALGKHLAAFSGYQEQFRHDCGSPRYVRYLDSVASRPVALQLRPDLQRTPLLSRTGDTVRWSDLMASHRGKVVYLDFWASWCGPCLAEMPASARVRRAVAGKPVQLVYVSVDTDSSKWRKALATHQLAAPGVQHYLLDPGSALAKFLNAPPIPRYVLVDKHGTVVSLDAARPSNPALLQDMAKLW